MRVVTESLIDGKPYDDQTFFSRVKVRSNDELMATVAQLRSEGWDLWDFSRMMAVLKKDGRQTVVELV